MRLGVLVHASVVRALRVDVASAVGQSLAIAETSNGIEKNEP
jgi:hypothetical protein